MQKLREIAYLARDFGHVVRGTDYFHAPQPVGRHFADTRCYYNDLRAKALWTGPMQEEVPLLYIPALERSVQFPIMILQYGLGSLDCWFESGDERFRRRAIAAVRWVVATLSDEGALPNYFPQLLPRHKFHSDNSGMAQGQALSLLARAIQHDLVDADRIPQAEAAIERIVANMLLPLDRGGTRLEVGGSTYFCEQCRVEPYVVLNGWIFAVFGLHDYFRWHPNDARKSVLDATLATLAREAGRFLSAGGWSRYDDADRVASPFYHRLHIAQFDALCRLFDEPAFHEILFRLQQADTRWNRWRSAAGKVKDRLVGSSRYTTSARIESPRTSAAAGKKVDSKQAVAGLCEAGIIKNKPGSQTPATV